MSADEDRGDQPGGDDRAGDQVAALDTAATLAAESRRRVARLLLQIYEDLDYLERLLASLLQDSSFPTGARGALKPESPAAQWLGSAETPLEGPSVLRWHVGIALAQVLRALQPGSARDAPHEGEGDPWLLEDVHRNVLTTMGVIGELLVETSLGHGTRPEEVERLAEQALSAVDAFISDPSAPRGRHS